LFERQSPQMLKTLREKVHARRSRYDRFKSGCNDEADDSMEMLSCIKNKKRFIR
jgi:hypothetical protein